MNIIKTAIVPKLIHRFKANSIKILSHHLLQTELEKANLKCIWDQKRPSIAKATMGHKSKAGWHHNPRLEVAL